VSDRFALDVFISLRPLAYPDMSSVSTSAAVGPIELSVRNRHEDADVVPILDDGNDALAASRLADSTVPDGGYGWILIAACGIVTFWFVGVFRFTSPIIRGLLSRNSQPDPSQARVIPGEFFKRPLLRRVSHPRVPFPLWGRYGRHALQCWLW
jgi:hypothetical protein